MIDGVFARTLPLCALFLAGCIDITGIPPHVTFEHRIIPPDCPTPAPVVNDPDQLPSKFPLGCPYGVLHPDGTVTIHTFGGPDQSPDSLPPLPELP